MIIWNRLRYVLSPQFDIYEEVAKKVRGKVADIGFGTGFGMHLYLQGAKEIYGYETDIDSLRFAQRAFPINKMYFQMGDVTKGIDETGFNFVTMIDVIEHIEKDVLALQNAKKMLAKGGVLIVSTPNRLSRYRKSENHVREYAPKELNGILKRVFVNVSLRDEKLEPLASQYQNPLVAICRNEA